MREGHIQEKTTQDSKQATQKIRGACLPLSWGIALKQPELFGHVRSLCPLIIARGPAATG